MRTEPAHNTRRGAFAPTLLALALAAATACAQKPEVLVCPSGVYCPPGAKCAANEDVCIFDDCGDGALQDGEACDDGNTAAADGCSRDCKSDETCGNSTVDASVGEVCDDGNRMGGDGCSADCRSFACGDVIVDASAGEECDDGNTSNDDDCRNDCRWNVCGDGYVNTDGPLKHEDCDLGADNGRTDCPYGLTSCPACSRECQATTAMPHYCGDGIVDVGEGERCDNSYSFACGSCVVATCEDRQPSRAQGTITVSSSPASVLDGDTVTLNDGSGTMTLEIDRNSSCAAGSTCIAVASGVGSAQIATSIRDAISAAHAQSFAIRTIYSADDRVVRVEHDMYGLAGNIPITANSPMSGLFVTGMGGGVGCPAGSPCSYDADCASMMCDVSMCQ